MDPNATLRDLGYALSPIDATNAARAGMPRDPEGAADAARHLRDWIRRGGFAPDWTAEPTAAAYFKATWPQAAWIAGLR